MVYSLECFGIDVINVCNVPLTLAIPINCFDDSKISLGLVPVSNYMSINPIPNAQLDYSCNYYGNLMHNGLSVP